MATSNDKIQFRGGEEKRASQLLSEMRLGGINISELAREGLKEKLGKCSRMKSESSCTNSTSTEN